MLLLLSYSLVKVPNHFNLNIETEPRNISRKSYEKILNSNTNIKKLNYYKTNKRSHYFKERDFIKKNLHIDLNYNNNFRKGISPHIKPRLSLSFEDFIFGHNYNPNITNTNNTNNISDKTNSKLYNINSRFNTEIGTKNSFHSKNEFFSSKNSLNTQSNEIYANKMKLDNELFNENLNTNIDKLINKIHENTLNFNLFKKKKGFGGTTRMGRIEILKEFLNENKVVNPPVKLKFPKINIKSNENVYRDTLDKKLTSLTMLSQKVKEQLKTKNRYFTAQKEFYKYNHSYFSNKQNPLTETVKCLEDKDKEKNTKNENYN